MVGFQDVCRCDIDSELKVHTTRRSAAIKTSALTKLIKIRSSADGHKRWKIDCCSDQTVMWLSVRSALQYLRRMESSIEDPQRKANAEASIQKLRKFVEKSQ
jgi:hypothetical protein